MSGFFGSLAGAIGSVTGALKWTGSAVAQAGTGDLSDVTAPTSWAPTDQSGGGLAFTSVSAVYFKLGNMIVAYGTLTYPATSDSHEAAISLPVAVPNQSYAATAGLMWGAAASGSTMIRAVPNSSTAALFGTNNSTQTNANLSGKTLTFSLLYPAS